MSLDLDTRQRAMLQEMGVTVWQPETLVEAAEDIQYVAEKPQNTINNIAAQAINTPATAINAPPRIASERPPVNLPVKAAPASSCRGVAAHACRFAERWIGQRCSKPRKAAKLANCAQVEKASFLERRRHMQQADWLIVGDPPTESDEAAGAAFHGRSGRFAGQYAQSHGFE